MKRPAIIDNCVDSIFKAQPELKKHVSSEFINRIVRDAKLAGGRKTTKLKPFLEEQIVARLSHLDTQLGKVSSATTGAVPTESLPAGQPTSGDVGVAGDSLVQDDDGFEMLKDMAKLRREQGRPDAAMESRIAAVEAARRGEEVEAGKTFSNVVVGHPQFDAPHPELRNLIPIYTRSQDEAQAKFDAAYKLLMDVKERIGEATRAAIGAKTPAQKKAADKKFPSSETSRLKDVADYLQNETLPELDRLINATPPPPQQQQPATPATQETKPQAEASPTQQPAEETGDAGVTDTGAPVIIDKQWTDLTDEEGPPPLDRDFVGYNAWKRKVAAKVLPNGTRIQQEALALELGDAISKENQKPGVESWQHHIIARNVSAQLMTGNRPEIIQSAETRAISDEYAQWFMGGVFEEQPISVKAYKAHSRGQPLPKGYVKQGDLYVFQPEASVSPASETVQSSETPSASSREQAASQRLTDYISTLSPKAQAAWTPERLAAAESYYATGNESALEPLTATQRKIVKREGVSDAERVADELKRISERKQREGKPIDDKLTAEEAVRRSIAELEAQPQSPRAKAVQAGVAKLDWANMDAKQRREAVIRFAQSIAKSFLNSADDFGGFATISLHADRAPSAGFNVSNGSLSIEIGTGIDFDSLHFPDNEQSVFSQAFSIVEEEFVHAAHIAAGFKRWQNLGSQGDFREWFERESFQSWTEIFDKVKSLVESGQKETAERINDIIYEASVTYHRGVPGELVGQMLTQQRPASKMYLELARMLAQVDLDSFTSEAEFTRFVKAVQNIFTKFLSLMREASELVKKGLLGDALKRDVAEIESVIRRIQNDPRFLAVEPSTSLRNPPPVTNTEFLDDYNAYVDALNEGQLNEARESREKAPEPEGPSDTEIEFSNEVASITALPDTATVEQVQKAAPVSVANAAASAASANSKTEWMAWMRVNLSHLVRFAEKIWKQVTASVTAAISLIGYNQINKPATAKEISPQSYAVADIVAKQNSFGRIAPWVESQKPSIPIAYNPLTGYKETLPSVSKDSGEVVLNISDKSVGTDVKIRQSPEAIAKRATKELAGDATMTVLPRRAAKFFLNQGSSPQVDALAELLYEQESTSPKIAKMLRDMGVSESPDTFPWCATSLSYALTRAGNRISQTSSRAFLNYGTKADKPSYGDVVVMWNTNPATGGKNGWGGHVGFYLGEVDGAIVVLSGNVNDEVNVSLYRKERVLGYRKPPATVPRASHTSGPESQTKAILRAKDGSVLRTGVDTLESEAARNSYEGVIPGVEQSWIGTSEQFSEQFPDGYAFGGSKKFPDGQAEALVASDGRVFIFTDYTEILEGDVERALRYGTTPGVEATKRLLRHEAFAHRGFMSLPAPLKQRFMDLIESGVIPEAELDYIVKERGYSQYADWRNDITQRQLLAEEWLAHKLDRITKIPQSGPLAQFTDWLRDVWRYLTGGSADSDVVLRDTMRQMHKALGALEPGQRIVDERVRASQRSGADLVSFAEYSAGVDPVTSLSQVGGIPFQSSQKEIVDRLIENGFDPKIRVFNNPSKDIAYFNGSDGILLNSAKLNSNPLMTALAITHEAVHSATYDAIRREENREITNRLNDLLIYARKQFYRNKDKFGGETQTILHSLSNLDEFLAGAFTSNSFRKVLSAMEISSRTGIKPSESRPSVFSKLIEIISQLINIGDKRTILEEVILSGEQLITKKSKSNYIISFSGADFPTDKNGIVFSSAQRASQRSGADAARDAEYLEAVRRGDMETEQRMVDEAARRAGATDRLQHWTNAESFTRFDPSKIGSANGFSGTQAKGFWFNDSDGTRSPFGSRKIDAFLILKNPKVFESAEAYDTATEEFDSSESFTSDLISQGYDGVIIRPAEEWMGSQEWDFNNYVAFSPNQIKSADPVTYYPEGHPKAGQPIPPSERFQSTSSDIRYSRRQQSPETQRFNELTRDLPAKPTAADKAKFQETHPDEYAELEKMREDVLKRGGWDRKFYHGTPTGGFTEFRRDYQGRTGGRARGGFSFTTNKDAAETYATGFSSEAVALDESIRIANKALSDIDGKPGSMEPFIEQGYEEGDSVPEFYWGVIDDNAEFAESLKEIAAVYDKTFPETASLLRQAASAATAFEGKAEVFTVFLKIPPNSPQFRATPETLGSVVASLDVRNEATRAAVVNMPNGETVAYVADPSQIKSADPLATDDSGNLITPDQWADETSADIRYSRRSVIDNNASFREDTLPQITAPNNPERLLNEVERGPDGIARVIPDKYRPFAKEGNFANALAEWAVNLIEPFSSSAGDMRKLFSITRNPAKLESELGITDRDGYAILPYLMQEAAIVSRKLGATELSNRFLADDRAISSAAATTLAARRFASNDGRFYANKVQESMLGVEQKAQRAAVDPHINSSPNDAKNKDMRPKTAADVLADVEPAGEEAAAETGSALEDEAMISEQIINLGIAAEDDPEIRALIESIIEDTILIGMLQAEDGARQSISARNLAERLKSKTAEEKQAILQEALQRREENVRKLEAAKDAVSKKAAKPKAQPVGGEKQPKAAKEVQTAKQIINRIAKKVSGADKKQPEPNAVRQLYKQQLQKPMDEADFMKAATAAKLDTKTAKELYDSINLELVALSIAAETAVAIRAENKALRDAEKESERVQKQAEAKIKEISDTLADPSLATDKPKKTDAFREIYNKQVKSPGLRQSFLDAMTGLGVEYDTAVSLYDMALLDTESRRAVQQQKAEVAKREMSEAAASKLIYTQEEKLRQGSKDTTANKAGDSINKAFREQVVKPLSLEQFRKRMDSLMVSQKVADRLFRTAGRVAFDDAQAEMLRKRLRFLDVDSAALANFINDLRRNGKLTGEPISWQEILSLPVSDQETVKEELLERIKKHSALRNLSATEQQALADALETVWQRERRKIFQRMIKRADMKGVSKVDQAKIADAAPKLLQYINQGMLGTDAFYRAVGEEYGFTPISKEDRARVEKLAEEAQAPGMSSLERQQKNIQILRILQKNTKLSRAEILSSIWVVHVLTGIRTQTDMALGVLNGALSVLKKAVDVGIVGRNPKLALQGLSDFGKFLVVGAQEAFSNMVKPELGILNATNASMNDAFEESRFKNALTTGDKMMLVQDKPGDTEWQKTKNKLTRGLGVWIAAWERIMGGWDHITSTATYMGSLRLASGLNPKLFDEALIPNAEDLKATMEIAKQRLPNGSRAMQSKLARSLLEDGVRALGRNIEESKMEQWRNMVNAAKAEGFTASFQEDPTGLGGVLYKGIRGLTQGLDVKAKEYRDDRRAARVDGRGGGALAQAFAEVAYIIAAQATNILGVRFIRFTGNKLNELISYVPVAGMLRLTEPGMKEHESLTLRGRNIYHNQALGAMAFGLYIYMLSHLDDEDEEKNVIVEGSWENLTPARKSQLMSQGLKPNTVRIRTADNRWMSFNYISWPFAGWLAGYGGLSDIKRYTPEKWNEKNIVERTMTAAYSGAFAISDISSLSQLSELFGRSTYNTDPTEAFAKRLSKATTNYAGGFIPRVFKDMDSWFDNTAYRPEDFWGYAASQFPVLRRSSGAPVRDIFYERVSASRAPFSRAFQMSPPDEAYKTLGLLNSRGIWLTPPNPENRKVRSREGLRNLTEDEGARYMELTGQGYRQMIEKYGERLLGMEPDRAALWVQKYAERVREISLKKALARRGSSVVIDAD